MKCASLLGEGTSERNLQRIREVVAAFPEVTRPGQMFSMHLGPDQILLAMHIDFKDELTAGELERIIPLIKERIRRELPEVQQIFLEAKQGAN